MYSNLFIQANITKSVGQKIVGNPKIKWKILINKLNENNQFLIEFW